MQPENRFEGLLVLRQDDNPDGFHCLCGKMFSVRPVREGRPLPTSLPLALQPGTHLEE